VQRSRAQTAIVTERLRVGLGRLAREDDTAVSPVPLIIADVYDPPSGGVRLRDWELDEVPPDHAISRLFELDKIHRANGNVPSTRWAMFTDTGILLRGPDYYYGYTHPRDGALLPDYYTTALSFLSEAKGAIKQLRSDRPTLTTCKLVLAVQDNVRNIMLQLLYVVLVAESSADEPQYAVTHDVFWMCLEPHTRQHYSFLLNPDADYDLSLRGYLELLSRIEDVLRAHRADVLRGFAACQDVDTLIMKRILKWRECDHFLQNVAAVQLGLQEIRDHTPVLPNNRVVGVGLPYGGLELPAIASLVCGFAGMEFVPGFIMGVSRYGDDRMGSLIREGSWEYVTGLLAGKARCLLPREGEIHDVADQKTVLLDDNCTTCSTLQLARDLLVTLGADVIGAVVVRFPSVNRHMQMSMPKHGFPDPAVLFSFIRGLLIPNPYSRLILRPEQPGQYEDQTGVFDKAKARISRYLTKNGTPWN